VVCLATPAKVGANVSANLMHGGSVIGRSALPCGMLSVAESCSGGDGGEGKKCVIRRGRPKCVCSPDCRKSRHKGPVCGTDGRSYTSVCRLRKRSCRKKNAALSVAYYGHCQSKSVLVSCHYLARSLLFVVQQESSRS
jgi:hypothetical protein